MRGKTAAAVVIAAIFIFGAAIGFLWRFPQRPRSALPNPHPFTPPATSSSSATRPAAGASISTDSTSSAEKLFAQLEALLDKLLRGQAAPADLAAVRRAFSDADPQEAINAILQFLASGRDAATGEELVVGPGGHLEGAPTLRLLLMDLLGGLARQTGGEEAAACARTVLEQKKSADEWAISLRNVAWHEPQATGYLAGKMRELLNYQPWLARPSAGILEAFDVLVYLRDPTFVPLLANFDTGNQPTLQRAAAIALDRLAEAAPLEVMNYLNSNPAVLADRPFVRADHFAKADVTQPAQRQALEIYLSRADVSLPEKTKLLKGLAVPSTFLSDNLLTAPPPEIDETTRVTALVKTMQEWLKANRFPDLAPQLFQMAQNLGTQP